jgi:hypothetical protein
METPTSPNRITGEIVSGLGAGGQNIYISRQLGLVVIRQTSTGFNSPFVAPTRAKFNSEDFFSLLRFGTLPSPDADGDLIVNVRDDFPNDPARWCDADDDGMDDLVEERVVDASDTDQIRNVSQVQPGDDFDGDGLTNFQEDLAGTDPANAASPDVEDLYRFHAAPVDLDRDGQITPADKDLLEAVIRRNEAQNMLAGRR